MPFIQPTSIFLWILILIGFSSTDQLRNRKLEQKVLLAYVNAINITAYKHICGKREWAWEERVLRRLKTISSKAINEW